MEATKSLHTFHPRLKPATRNPKLRLSMILEPTRTTSSTMGPGKVDVGMLAAWIRALGLRLRGLGFKE